MRVCGIYEVKGREIGTECVCVDYVKGRDRGTD